MKKKCLCIFSYLLLFFLLVFLVFAIYMSYKTQKAYNEAVMEASEDYHYDEIQDMVTYDFPITAETEDKSFSPPYDKADMLAINQDFKGWLWIPGTDVNYPVTQTNNNDTYLKRSFEGEYSSYGTLFLDVNSIEGSQNRVIHGHNMGTNRTEMFSCLTQYQDPLWAADRTVAYFTEPDAMEDSTYELFAVLNFDVGNLDQFNYLQAVFETNSDFHSFIDYLKDKSLYKTTFHPERDILILSTCNRYYGYDNRLLVCFGRLQK